MSSSDDPQNPGQGNQSPGGQQEGGNQQRNGQSEADNDPGEVLVEEFEKSA